MALFSRDPAKKQIDALLKNLPEDKRNKIHLHLNKYDEKVKVLWEVLTPEDGPDAWVGVVQVYAAALLPGDPKRQKRAIETIDDLSSGSRADRFKPCEAIVTGPLSECVADSDLEVKSRIMCAEILARLGNKGIAEPVRLLLSDASIGARDRLRCASILGEIGDKGSVEPVRSLVNSLKSVDLYHVGKILAVYRQLGIADGKEFAYASVREYLKYNTKMGIGDAEHAFDEAVPYLVAQGDDKTADDLVELLNKFVAKLKASTSASETGFAMDPTPHSLDKTASALAASGNPKLIEALVRFIGDAVSLSSEGAQIGANTYLRLPGVVALRESARGVIRIWVKSGNAQALALLNDQLGVERVKTFLDNRD